MKKQFIFKIKQLEIYKRIISETPVFFKKLQKLSLLISAPQQSQNAFFMINLQNYSGVTIIDI